jgi:hypothetical protein
MPKRGQRTKTSTSQSREAFPTLSNAVTASIRTLDEGMGSIRRPSTKVSDAGKLVRSLLDALGKFARGDISSGELLSVQASIPKRFLRPSPPPWLPPGQVWQLQQYFDKFESQRKGATKEVLDWLYKRYSSPVGRPPSPETYAIGGRAAELKRKGYSWKKIAQKICPDRDSRHECSKLCQDRIRQAAQPFRKT